VILDFRFPIADWLLRKVPALCVKALKGSGIKSDRRQIGNRQSAIGNL